MGVYIIREASLIDANDLAAMAITTVGYDETIPLYKAGRIFTILLVAGCITYVFVITCIIQFSMGEKMSF
ncbi:MAG TPA: ion channel [Chitinophagaceae bacterium]|nr:ion channel [Chitinophagaceae bacterium]HQX73701.1 ion channel [Chitinophagaceae bacterium]